MLNISKVTKIFVPCPAGACTGGAELLHQLVDLLNRTGLDAYIVYYGNAKHDLPNDYKKYVIKFAESIEDKADNVAVIHEGCFNQLFHIHDVQIMLWWLSVDYYYICNNHTAKEIIYYQINYPEKLGFKKFIKGIVRSILKPNDSISMAKLKRMNVKVNAFQSEYAKDILSKNNFSELFPLKDYINDDNFSYVLNKTGRQNIVIYNPKKGIEFTKKLIGADRSILWVPIINMSRSEVLQLMRNAKVYIDFGFHPGKDRLPREAAINGCCIVTGLHGSANYIDINIPTKYKHTQRKEDIPNIIKQIHELLEDYDNKINEYSIYREAIRKEKEEFISDAKMIFHLS